MPGIGKYLPSSELLDLEPKQAVEYNAMQAKLEDKLKTTFGIKSGAKYTQVAKQVTPKSRNVTFKTVQDDGDVVYITVNFQRSPGDFDDVTEDPPTYIDFEVIETKPDASTNGNTVVTNRFIGDDRFLDYYQKQALSIRPRQGSQRLIIASTDVGLLGNEVIKDALTGNNQFFMQTRNSDGQVLNGQYFDADAILKQPEATSAFPEVVLITPKDLNWASLKPSFPPADAFQLYK